MQSSVTVGYVALLFELNVTLTKLPTLTVFAAVAATGEANELDVNANALNPVTTVVLMYTAALIVPAVVWK